jgi:hypothetical protein
MVTVRNGALAGRPADWVVRYLRRRGLLVDLHWQVSAGRPPGTVLSVLPTGRVPVGARVGVTVAFQPVAAGARDHDRPVRADTPPGHSHFRDDMGPGHHDKDRGHHDQRRGHGDNGPAGGAATGGAA